MNSNIWYWLEDHIILTVVTVFIGMIGVTVGGVLLYESAYPCLRSRTERVLGYQKIGNMMVPVYYNQTVCLERQQ